MESASTLCATLRLSGASSILTIIRTGVHSLPAPGWAIQPTLWRPRRPNHAPQPEQPDFQVDPSQLHQGGDSHSPVPRCVQRRSIHGRSLLVRFAPSSQTYIPTKALSSSWAGNCAVQPDTNGVDYYAEESESRRRVPELEPVAEVVDLEATGYVLPPEYVPTAPSVNATSGVIKSYILPDNKTGVVCIILRFWFMGY